MDDIEPRVITIRAQREMALRIVANIECFLFPFGALGPMYLYLVYQNVEEGDEKQWTRQYSFTSFPGSLLTVTLATILCFEDMNNMGISKKPWNRQGVAEIL